MKDIKRKHITLLPGVPTLFSAIASKDKLSSKNFPSLKLGISGGAPLPSICREEFEHLSGCRLLEGYGLTECSPVVAVQPEVGSKTGAVGLPLPGTVIEIHDTAHPGKVLSPEGIGEICVRGPQIMQGYFRQKQETSAVLDHGLLHTGDVGYLDKEGFLFVVDRLKDVIISGGYKIYPQSVEDAIYRHPQVREAAVIGIEDAHRGQSVKAFIVCKEGEMVTQETLSAFLAPKLAAFEIPSEVEYVESLPKTLIGKIEKKALRSS